MLQKQYRAAMSYFSWVITALGVIFLANSHWLGGHWLPFFWEAMQEEQLKLEKAEAQIQVLIGWSDWGGPIGWLLLFFSGEGWWCG